MTNQDGDLIGVIRRAALLFAAAEFFYAGAGAMTKIASMSAPHSPLVFVQLGSAFLILLPYILCQKISLKTKRPFGHIFRALALTGNFYLLYWAIRYLPVGDALLLNNAFPLFVPLIVWAFTRQPPSLAIWTALGLGFVGVACILRPGPAIFQPASLIAIASATCAALAVVLVNRLATTEPLPRMLFYTLLIPTLITGLVSIPYWEPIPLACWGWLIATGASLAVFQFLLTCSLSMAPPGPVSTMAYTAVFFGGIIDWLFWNHPPDLWFLVGTLFIVTAGVRVIVLRKPVSSSSPK
jgi:drug/metabolite transporter (DMT)-like permease